MPMLRISKSQRDILDAVIITKIIVSDMICYADYCSATKFKLPILQPWVKLKLCLIFQQFQNGRHFEIATNNLPEVIPEVEYTSKTAMGNSNILSFRSTRYLKYWRRYINFKIWPTLWPDDVIDDVTSAWNITYTTRHRQLRTPKYCLCDTVFRS